ncbi:TIR domain-containing protein [Ekhidna sp.]
MIELNPNVEVLFEDLRRLGINSFLVSRKFKIMLNEEDMHELWRDRIWIAGQKRNVTTGPNQEMYKAVQAFASFMNQIESDQSADDLVAQTIISFIDSFDIRQNLKDIKESFGFVSFSNDNRLYLIDSIARHNRRKFKPKTPVKNLDQETVESEGEKENSKIFIVHGHNEGMKEGVARFVEKLGFNGIILHEQPNEGKTIIEKFTKYSDVGFAIVLLSADDFGFKKDQASDRAKLRARQNVIMELGYFLGKIGREKVVALHETVKNFEFPSDYSGVLYIPYGDNWKVDLAKELKAAGFQIDMNKIFE